MASLEPICVKVCKEGSDIPNTETGHEGCPLVIGDWMISEAERYPLKVGYLTFQSGSDKAVYDGSKFYIQGSATKSNEVGLYDYKKETLSHTAKSNTQSLANEEFVEGIEKIVEDINTIKKVCSQHTTYLQHLSSQMKNMIVAEDDDPTAIKEFNLYEELEIEMTDWNANKKEDEEQQGEEKTE